MPEDAKPQSDSSADDDAKSGHNQPVWDRWQKKRTFVRALEGTYGEVYKSLYNQPRVIPAPSLDWHGGPAYFHKIAISPQNVTIAQSIECHVDSFAPGAYGQKHGHMNSAVFYVLTGKGYDIHDGVRLEYEAGDVSIVETSCVHQHFNRSDTEQMACLVMKAKPLFLFMHMVFQKTVAYPSDKLAKGHEDFSPPTNL
ncbi:MAG: quercetin dioxygenase-like cupin family protein [Alphaproteobacteria bacterium]|jgi:quercetin dioxygenase-like cupin family protein